MTSKERFKELAEQWEMDTLNVSSLREIIEHPAYQAIIAMGPEAVPFILEDLQANLRHWFHALTAITGENPVPKGRWGYIREAADAWITWGISHGFINKKN